MLVDGLLGDHSADSGAVDDPLFLLRHLLLGVIHQGALRASILVVFLSDWDDVLIGTHVPCWASAFTLGPVGLLVDHRVQLRPSLRGFGVAGSDEPFADTISAAELDELALRAEQPGDLLVDLVLVSGGVVEHVLHSLAVAAEEAVPWASDVLADFDVAILFREMGVAVHSGGASDDLPDLGVVEMWFEDLHHAGALEVETFGSGAGDQQGAVLAVVVVLHGLVALLHRFVAGEDAVRDVPLQEPLLHGIDAMLDPVGIDEGLSFWISEVPLEVGKGFVNLGFVATGSIQRAGGVADLPGAGEVGLQALDVLHVELHALWDSTHAGTVELGLVLGHLHRDGLGGDGRQEGRVSLVVVHVFVEVLLQFALVAEASASPSFEDAGLQVAVVECLAFAHDGLACGLIDQRGDVGWVVVDRRPCEDHALLGRAGGDGLRNLGAGVAGAVPLVHDQEIVLQWLFAGGEGLLGVDADPVRVSSPLGDLFLVVPFQCGGEHYVSVSSERLVGFDGGAGLAAADAVRYDEAASLWVRDPADDALLVGLEIVVELDELLPGRELAHLFNDPPHCRDDRGCCYPCGCSESCAHLGVVGLIGGSLELQGSVGGDLAVVPQEAESLGADVVLADGFLDLAQLGLIDLSGCLHVGRAVRLEGVEALGFEECASADLGGLNVGHSVVSDSDSVVPDERNLAATPQELAAYVLVIPNLATGVAEKGSRDTRACACGPEDGGALGESELDDLLFRGHLSILLHDGADGQSEGGSDDCSGDDPLQEPLACALGHVWKWTQLAPQCLHWSLGKPSGEPGLGSESCADRGSD